MAKEYLQFEDESGDKQYFAIIPYIIINGYTAEESGVYAYIKRKCGESKGGTWFETKSEVAKKLGISPKTFRKILRKLEKGKRIIKVGTKILKTSPIDVYKITDIWKENVLAYQKKRKGKKTSLSNETKREGEKRPLREGEKRPPKKNPIKKKHNINNIVNYFFELKGWANKEKSFYKKNKIVYSRFTRPAKELLELCEGNQELAKKKLKFRKQWAEERGLEWGINTAIKRWFEKDKLKELSAPRYKKLTLVGDKLVESSMDED